MKNKKFNNYFLIAIVILTGMAVFKIIMPFLATLLTAFIFWQLFNPVYTRLAIKLKNSQLAAFLTCLLVFLLIILPLFVIGSIATKEALDVYGRVTEDTNVIGMLQEKLRSFFYTYSQKTGISQSELDQSFGSIDLKEIAQKAAGLTADLLQQAYQQVSQFIIFVFIMLFTLNYLFIDGERFIKYLFHISPLGVKDETLIWKRFLSMSRATLKGTLIIGLIHGIIGGLTFWLLGIGSPSFWGVIMGILSLFPIPGPVAIWIPASIWQIFSGAWLNGLLLAIIGGLTIGILDNVLRPRLIGKDTSLHPVLILIGTLGGIVEFGVLGIVIGPLIITIFVTLLEIFERKFQEELK